MKIAIVIPDNRDELRRYSDPAPFFGAPTALFEGLADIQECEIHVVSCTQKPLRSPEKLAGNIYFHSVLVPKWGWMRGAYVGCVRALSRKLREIKPELVHGQGTERYSALAAVFSGFPNVLTIHGNMRLVAKVNRAKPFSFAWLAARLETFTLPRSDGIVCISTYTQHNVAGLARKTWVVPNAVDGSFFDLVLKPAELRQILCVAHISVRKNQVQLIRALDPLAAKEKFELVFYGGANRKDPYVEDFFALLKDRPWCRYAGFADRSGLKAALASSTASVLPSLEDNCPMSVLEAMAAGVPVAAAKVGGVPDLVTPGVDGLLFDPEQLDSIRSAVSEILTDQPRAAQLARMGKETALRRFRPNIIARRHLEIYHEVLGRRPKV